MFSVFYMQEQFLRIHPYRISVLGLSNGNLGIDSTQSCMALHLRTSSLTRIVYISNIVTQHYLILFPPFWKITSLVSLTLLTGNRKCSGEVAYNGIT